ncbi:MAG: hypothetical protein IJW85_11615, partial [Clostridia bacterium]|nr:hypothetical protein [Clostridia bacterium]
GLGRHGRGGDDAKDQCDAQAPQEFFHRSCLLQAKYFSIIVPNAEKRKPNPVTVTRKYKTVHPCQAFVGMV